MNILFYALEIIILRRNSQMPKAQNLVKDPCEIGVYLEVLPSVQAYSCFGERLILHLSLTQGGTGQTSGRKRSNLGKSKRF